MMWEKVKLGDCCTSITDGDHQAPPKSKDGIPFITIANIDQFNSIDFTNTMHVPKDYFDSLDSKRKPHVGNIIYSVVGSFGIPVYIKNDDMFTFQRHIAILKCKENINSRFLYYVMKSRAFYHQADSVAIGSAQKTITLSALRDMEVHLPERKVQNKIASILSAYDDLIENNRRQMKLLEEAAERLYKEWFVKFHYPNRMLKNNHFNLKDRTRVSLDSMGVYINGYAFKPSDWQTSGYPIIKIKEMMQGIEQDTPRNNGKLIPGKYVIPPGTIIFSWSATLDVKIWGQETGLLNQHLFKVIPKRQYGREFVYQSIKTSIRGMENLTSGSTMKHIQRGKLKELYVDIPDMKIVKKYNEITNFMRNEILNLQAKNIFLQEARDRLLPKLMSGEVEV